jgi:hypothetical protein
MTNEDTLNRFYLVTEALRSAMQVDMPLDESDQLRLENHMALLHMAYVEWKRRNLTRQRNIVWNSSIDKTATHARRLS